MNHDTKMLRIARGEAGMAKGRRPQKFDDLVGLGRLLSAVCMVAYAGITNGTLQGTHPFAFALKALIR